MLNEDVQAIVDWEIAHGNVIRAVTYPFGEPVVLFERPLILHETPDENTIAGECQWWEFRDCHYHESQWCAGYTSATSQQKVAGPMKPTTSGSRRV